MGTHNIMIYSVHEISHKQIHNFETAQVNIDERWKMKKGKLIGKEK